jgi:hypothetical protein
MQRVLKKQTRRRVILAAILIFLSSYFIFLMLWIQVKNGYGSIMTLVVSEAIPFVLDVQFEEIKGKEDLILATFSRDISRHATMLIDIPIKTSSYTFNVPLTFAIMAALFPFIQRRWRAYAEAVWILLGVHLLYLYSLEAHRLILFFASRGIPLVSNTCLFCHQFFWEFTNNMVIRFEPFLIGFYMYIRFRK